MVDPSLVSNWLRARTIPGLIIEIWLFGSTTKGEKSKRDVDVYIKYKDGGAEQMPTQRRSLEAGFRERFGLPLHCLFLSETESLASMGFLSIALKSGVRVY
jgi:predicted nucleotidyltransferase